MIYYYIYLFLVIICTIFIKKKGFLLNFSGDIHQSFSNKRNIPLVGGLFILIPIIFFLNDIVSKFVVILIFLIGFFSDRKILISPKKRFFFQSVIILLFVIAEDSKIVSSRIDFFDIILQNEVPAYLFSTFCLLILINGSNFIDGLNGILITYAIIVLYLLSNLGLINSSIISDQSIKLILLFLFLILFLNIFNFLMLGDGGAYLIGFFLGYLIITSHMSNPEISPYFFISLIWYPCFENLFSILRKLNKNFSPLKPDSKHLHQLIFFFVTKRIKLNIIIANNLSSLIICLFNFLIIYISSLDPYNTFFQIKLITSAIIFYNIFYVFLNRFYRSKLYSKE